MFVVHQDGNFCVNLKSVSYGIDWDDNTKKELRDIHNRMYSKAYNYGSTDNCLRAIKREQDNFTSSHKSPKVLQIYVNDNLFATYKNVENGLAVYKEILEGLKNNNTLIDLSQNKFNPRE